MAATREFRLVQVVGTTSDEPQAARSWNVKAFAGLLASRASGLVTDLARASWMRDSTFAHGVEEGASRDVQ